MAAVPSYAAQINPPRPPQPLNNRPSVKTQRADDDDDEQVELRGSTAGARGLFTGDGLPSMQPTKIYDPDPILHRPGYANAQAVLQLLKGKAKRDSNVVIQRYMTELLSISEADLARRKESPEVCQVYLENVQQEVQEHLGRVLGDTTEYLRFILDSLVRIQDELRTD